MKRLRNVVAAAVAIVALLIAAPSSSLIGIYVRPPIAAYVTQYAAQHDIARIGRIAEQPSKQAIPLPIQELQQADLLGRGPAVQPPGKSDGSGEQTAAWDAVPTTMVGQATEILEEERRRADGLENELAELRPSIERCELRLRDAAATAPQSQEPDREKTSALLLDLAAARQELTANEAQYRKPLAEECDRSAVASELATAQRNVETQVVQSNKTANEAAQLKKAADTAASELQRERERAEALASELAKVRREVETAAAESSQKDDEAVQQKQTAEAAIADLQQLLQQEPNKTAALTQEVGAARQAMTANAEQQRRALDEARARAAALASELAGTRREIETQATQSQKAVDEAVQRKQTAETAIADLQQLLQQEQNKTAALTQEIGAARQAMTANAEQQRRALDEARARAAALASELAGTRREIETQATQSQKAVDEAVQQKQTAEAAIADLQQLLRQERDRTEAMARDLASVRRTMDGRVAAGRSADNDVVHVTQAVKTAVTEPSKAAEAQGSAEAAKLIARASALLGQGNIGAARIVLQRAGESGNAQASFMLAETYDPVILSAWGTYGTRGDAAKAREFYAKATVGGIQEAKDRLNALRQ